MTKRRFIRQIVFPLLAAFIWGTAFVAQRRASELLPHAAFTALRSAVAVAVLAPAGLLFRRASAHRGKTPRENDLRALFTGGTLMGLTLAVAANLQQAGIAVTSIGKAGFISASYVVLTPVLGLFLKKPVRPLVWCGVALSAVGLYLLCLKPGESLLGSVAPADLYLIGCAFFYAVQIHIIDKYVERADGILLAAVQFAVTSVISFVLSFCFETVEWSNLALCVGPLLYVGVISSGLAYALQILAQEGSNPTVVTLLFSLESVFSVLAGAVMLHETLSAREASGCALTFAAVVLAQLPEGKIRSRVKKE